MSNTDEEKVFDLLRGIQLDQFYRQVVDKLHVTRFNHFEHVTEEDLDGLGMSKPEQRRLFEALKKARKKSLFGSFRRKKSKNKLLTNESGGDQTTTTTTTTTSSPTPSVSSTLPSSSLTCLINEKSLTLYDMIGNGAFGYVRKGEWITDSKQKIEVAVKCIKMVRDSAFMQMQIDFIKEANAMSLLDHPHIIKLYGVVLSTPLMLVTELAPLGCLLTCLRNNQPKFLISQLCDFVIQVASGMAYLESQHYIHRDLAARNLLLSSYDKVKIGDFGLMRPLAIEEDYYTMNPKGKVPFAWCPPESLKFRKFSHASDVWAFGITVTELFSYGAEPWPGLNGGQILQKVDLPQSERPQKPSHCPSKIYNVLFSHCWAHEPAQRPKFLSLQNMFEAIRPEDVRAIRSYDSKSPQNLCFEEGDSITLIESSSDSSWWRGQNKKTGRVGMFPCELVEGGKSSGSSPKSVQDAAAIGKDVLPPSCLTERKQQCDCGEKHIYDFPVLLNSPTPTSPDGTRNSLRSFDSDLFNTESDSGYSSSADHFHRSNSDCSQDLRKDLNSYENCAPSYELMGPGVPLPSRPVPIPKNGHGSPHTAVSDPVSIPVNHSKRTIRERMSDPNPTPKCGFSKGRISDPEPDKKPGPFILSRRVSAKKLNSFSILPKNGETKRCPLDFTDTALKSTKRNSGVESPPPLPPKESSSRPNSNSSISPQKSPVLPQRTDSCKESNIGEAFANEMSSFMISCSADGFDSEALKQAHGGMREKIPNVDDGISGRSKSVGNKTQHGLSNTETFIPQQERSKSVGSKTQRGRSNTEILNPSETILNGEVDVPERSNSVKGRTERGRSNTEVYENHERIPRSKSVGSRSLEYENHAMDARQDLSFQSYDNFKFKATDPTKKQSSSFYENHDLSSPVSGKQTINPELEQTATYDNHKLVKDDLRNTTRKDDVVDGKQIVNSLFGVEVSESNVKLEQNAIYDNHKLMKDDLKNTTRNVRVSYENVSQKSTVQNYEKMILRKSFIENENVSRNLKREKDIGSVRYENCFIGSQKSQPCYENFVLVEHSDVPEDISVDSNNLRCPSHENHGFSELEVSSREELKLEETGAPITQTLLEKDSAILSKSLPTSCDWKVVKESIGEDGTKSILVEIHGTSNLRKTSSDGDVSESKQNKRISSRPDRDETSAPIPPPRWKKKAREAKKLQMRWTLNVTGDLASAISNYFHQQEKSLKDLNSKLIPQASNGNNLEDTKPTLRPRKVEEHRHLLKEKTSDVLEKKTEIPSQEKMVSPAEGTLNGNVPLPLIENKKLPSTEKFVNGIVSEQEVDTLPFVPIKKEAFPKDPVSLSVNQSTESPSPALEELRNGLKLNEKADLDEEKPQRPNVLCFENKLAGFAEMYNSQITVNELTEGTVEDVPALPPKGKYPINPPGRRNNSRSSQYPRLSRDSTNTKLSFEESGERYKPCPTNGGTEKAYDVACNDVYTDNLPPPLPRKVSKSKTVPDVPPRPDLACS